MIRLAELSDLPRVSELCMIALQELGPRLPVPLDIEKLADSVLENWVCAPCFVFEKDGEIEGFYGLIAYYPFYSKEAVLGDYMIYLSKKYRTYKNLAALSKAARDFADEKKMVLDLNFITEKNSLTKARFLENMGAEIIGVKALYRGK